MNTRSSQVGSSPRRSDYQQSTTPHSLYVPATEECSQSPRFMATNDPYADAGRQPASAEIFHQRYRPANDTNQYHGYDLQGQHLQPQQAAVEGSPAVAGSNHELLHGLANYAQASSPHSQRRETSNLPPHHASSPIAVLASPYSEIADSTSRGMSYPPQLPYKQHSSAEHDVAPPRQSKYEPFQYRFHDAEQAREHRRRGTHFDRTPYCSPETDDTIAEVERDRLQNVMRIYNAMTSGEAARDNPGSIAVKRWVTDAHYPPDLVEAYAHKVFDCLMQQVRDGFRGWIHNDYVADERKGDDIDKDVDCAGRLHNIILALSQEKTICEDVMNSACQIRMFVNAPRAYSNRKHQNRIGNSKRVRTKDAPDPNTKMGKARRTATGRARAQTSSMSTLHTSRESTPQQQQQQQQPQALQRSSLAPPYYASPASQQLSPSPNLTTSYPAPPTPHGLPLPLQRPDMPAPHPAFIQHGTTAFSQHGPNIMSSPMPSPHMLQVPQSHKPCMTTEPPHTHPPTHLAFPSLSPHQGIHSASAPASPDELKPVSAVMTSNMAVTFEPHLDIPHASWIPDGPLIDPTLSQCQWDLPHVYTPSEDEIDSGSSIFPNNLTGYVNMSQVEGSRIYNNPGVAEGSTFEDMWRAHEGVQEFPSLDANDGGAREHRGSFSLS
jgi:hypothetical protein